jgi:hypothetical protein
LECYCYLQYGFVDLLKVVDTEWHLVFGAATTSTLRTEVSKICAFVFFMVFIHTTFDLSALIFDLLSLWSLD